MDKKAILPAVTISLLSCIALMLAVIGGLYTYNTFVADAEPVSAQGNGGTDKGPSWSVTPITTGGDKQHLVIVREVENPYGSGQAMQMAVYEIQGNNATGRLYFVAARLIEYDFQLPYIQDTNTRGDGWEPLEIKQAVEEARAERDRREEEQDRRNNRRNRNGQGD